MDWTTIVLDVLTLLIVIAAFLAIRDNRIQSKVAVESHEVVPIRFRQSLTKSYPYRLLCTMTPKSQRQ
jgi:hypothetical protein